MFAYPYAENNKLLIWRHSNGINNITFCSDEAINRLFTCWIQISLMMSFYIYNPQEEAISSSDFIIGVLLWVAQVKCLNHISVEEAQKLKCTQFWKIEADTLIPHTSQQGVQGSWTV